MPSTIQEYFVAIAPIWSMFFAGKISGAARERMLAPFRAALEHL